MATTQQLEEQLTNCSKCTEINASFDNQTGFIFEHEDKYICMLKCIHDVMDHCNDTAENRIAHFALLSKDKNTFRQWFHYWADTYPNKNIDCVDGVTDKNNFKTLFDQMCTVLGKLLVNVLTEFLRNC